MNKAEASPENLCLLPLSGSIRGLFFRRMLVGFCHGLLLWGSQTAEAAPGYLLAIGPAPLKFQKVHIHSPAVETLLASDHKEETSIPTETLAAAEGRSVSLLGPTPSTGDEEDFSDFGTKLPEMPAEELLNQVLTETKATPFVPPQLFLKFFNKKHPGATNAPPAVNVIAPIEFNPPQTIVFPPSSATYSTPER